MTSIDKLKSIVCFKEELHKQSLPHIQISYMELMSDQDQELIRMIKTHNRELAIDIVLDEKDESEWDKRDILPTPSTQEMNSTITPKIMSLTVASQKFIDYDTLYLHVIQHINKLTSTTKSYLNKPAPTLDYTITHDSNKTNEENNEINSRKVITKIIAASNIIAMEGRLGPGTGVLVGQNVANKVDLSPLSGFGSAMLVIVEPLIDPDKIIVCRSGGSDSTGIKTIVFPNDGKYFLKETPVSWQRQYCWFKVV